MKILHTIIIVIVASIILKGCASSPSRINELTKGNGNLGLDIVLNGRLVKLDEKFTLDNFYSVPSALPDNPVYHPYLTTTQASTYTTSPSGPWEFNWKTFFPVIDILRATCPQKKGDCKSCKQETRVCDFYEKQESPFIRVSCGLNDYGYTYSQRLKRIESNEQFKRSMKNTTAKDAAEMLVIVPLVTAALATAFIGRLPYIPGALAGACKEKFVEFDHDSFYDTVKAAVIAEYGSINEYISNIRHVSIVYKRLKAANDRTAKEVESAVQNGKSRLKNLLSETDTLDNYQVDYTAYILDKIPKQADWETYQVTIENEIAAHYKEQLESINRQLDAKLKSDEMLRNMIPGNESTQTQKPEITARKSSYVRSTEKKNVVHTEKELVQPKSVREHSFTPIPIKKNENSFKPTKEYQKSD
jgi:hypothetical protein